MLTDEGLETLRQTLPYFRRSTEILQMRKKCRLDIEKMEHEGSDASMEIKCLKIIDNELIRRGLRKA